MEFPAARVGDFVTHDTLVPSGAIFPPLSPPAGSPVIIEGLPAAYVTCTVLCVGTVSAPPGMAHPPPPPGTPPVPIIIGSPTVLINGFPAARWVMSGDMAACTAQLGDPKLLATRTVLIGSAASAGAGAPPGGFGGGAGGGAEALADTAAAAEASDAATGAAAASAAATQSAPSAAAGPPTTPERAMLRQNVLNDMQATNTSPVAPTSPLPAEKLVGDPAVTSGNPELMAKYQELLEIDAKLKQGGFTPKPDAEMLAAVNRGDYDDVRFIVSIQASKKTYDEPIAYMKPDTHRSAMWTAPFDVIKAGGLNPALLCALTGTTYYPDARYDMFILDKGEDYKVNGSYSIPPTRENLKRFGPNELHPDAPADPIHDKELLTKALEPEFQPIYREKMEVFWKEQSEAKKRKETNPDEQVLVEWSADDMSTFAKSQFATDAEADLFMARHLHRTQLGVNPYWRGDGTTEFLTTPTALAAVARSGVGIRAMPGGVGVPEVLTIEKDSPHITELQSKNHVLAIPMQSAKPEPPAPPAQVTT